MMYFQMEAFLEGLVEVVMVAFLEGLVEVVMVSFVEGLVEVVMVAFLEGLVEDSHLNWTKGPNQCSPDIVSFSIEY